ncbi:NmrA family NAD(P)-binding protein [Dactylosporangium sp. NPDC051485]|uniref:NmrA family NAD(P)-binding protein n=1 Tax=Dactylosporangium sp. NPDC051485 TaxID=3154846 RepID=UPI00343923C6
MTVSTTVLVTGATGRQGGSVARRLLAEGRPVRVLVRKAATASAAALAAAGAELAQGDFDDPASLPPAFKDVAAVFAMPPTAISPSGPDTELEVRRGRALIDAAAAAGVEQVVFSTVASGSAAKVRIERHLFDTIALPTVLRPVRFMTNYISTGMLGIEGISGGIHRHLFPPHEPMQVVALEDIADLTALALAAPERFAGRTLELAGDQPTPVEAAAAISEATGIPVRYEQITDDEAEALGPVIAEARKRWRAGHRWHADIEALRVIHPGLRTFADWLNESGAAAIRAHLLAAG